MKYSLLLLMLLSLYSLANESMPCKYFSVTELEPIQENACIDFTAWKRKGDNSDALITKKVAITASYDVDDLSFLYSDFGVFYFLKSGKSRKTIVYDNGPDYFQDGLARTRWEGKIGFFNNKLDIVISPGYDFAFPFDGGFSLVCNGCIKKSDGEHSTIVGGNWGVIDKQGTVVVPIQFTKNTAHNELAKKGTSN